MAGYLEMVQRIKGHNADPVQINLISNNVTDAKFAELADWLVAHPDVVTEVWLNNNELTDVSGVKLATFVSRSNTIRRLCINRNNLGEATYIAMAEALSVNTSLEALYLCDNEPVDEKRVDAAFIRALRVNPKRPSATQWHLYSMSLFGTPDYDRLKGALDGE